MTSAYLYPRCGSCELPIWDVVIYFRSDPPKTLYHRECIDRDPIDVVALRDNHDFSLGEEPSTKNCDLCGRDPRNDKSTTLAQHLTGECRSVKQKKTEEGNSDE